MRLILRRILRGTASALFAASLLISSPPRAQAAKSALKKLAQQHFPKMQLTACEKNLLEHASSGKAAYCGPSHSGSDQPPNGIGKKRTPFDVDADLIRWLCTDPAAVKLIDPKGIQFQGARVIGKLDLSYVTVRFPLSFRNSTFTENISLAYSELVNFDLSGSHAHAIEANNLTDRGDFILSKAVIDGRVELDEANLGGDLSCYLGFFKNQAKVAIEANRLKASVVFLQGATVEGEVSIEEANLTSLECSGGTFKNPTDDAIDAFMLKSGYVSLIGVKVAGEVILMGADLSGVLACDGGTFKNPGHVALDAGSLKADSFLLRKSMIEGATILRGADLSGILECDGGTFKNPTGIALAADGLRASEVFLRDGFNAEGEVALPHANIGGTLDCGAGKFKDPGKSALRACGIQAANVFLNRGFSAEGEVCLESADLRGNLDCGSGTFKNPKGTALAADGIKATDVSLDNGFNAEGEVQLAGANLRGDLGCSSGIFKSPGDYALQAGGLQVAGDILFNRSGTEGVVNFAGANVKGDFEWTKISPNHRDRIMLNLTHATVGPLVDDEKSWPAPGKLGLDGFVYSRFDNLAGGPIDAVSRLRWLELQPLGFASQPYEQLAKVLREAGDEVGAKSVLIAMENARLRYGNIGWLARFWNCVLDVTIGYGYDTWRALWFIAGFVVLGTFMFSLGYWAEAIVQIDKEQPGYVRPFNPFIYSLETFLPLVDLRQSRHWAPDPHSPLAEGSASDIWAFSTTIGLTFGRVLRWYLWLHILMGWFFTSMLIAGITGLVQKS